MRPIRPTRNDVETLQIGFLAPNPYGTLGRVVEIFSRGTDPNNRVYVGYYTETGAGGKVSSWMKEDEVYMSLPVCTKYGTKEIPLADCTTLLIAANAE